MKNFKNWALFIMVALLVMAAPAFGQDTTVVNQSGSVFDSIFGFISDNWPLISGILCYILYRLIPTKNADVVMRLLTWAVSLIPDNKKGGGKYKINHE